MFEALEQKTALTERRPEFVAAALAAEQEVAQQDWVSDADELLA